ncbi:hypothetical protein K439DRAFT_562252 [Ramaria rubella]|nr:hypothetical protein K439DRAFT_562252 [Ramaria rubella]
MTVRVVLSVRASFTGSSASILSHSHSATRSHMHTQSRGWGMGYEAEAGLRHQRHESGLPDVHPSRRCTPRRRWALGRRGRGRKGKPEQAISVYAWSEWGGGRVAMECE